MVSARSPAPPRPARPHSPARSPAHPRSPACSPARPRSPARREPTVLYELELGRQLADLVVHLPDGLPQLAALTREACGDRAAGLRARGAAGEAGALPARGEAALLRGRWSPCRGAPRRARSPSHWFYFTAFTVYVTTYAFSKAQSSRPSLASVRDAAANTGCGSLCQLLPPLLQTHSQKWEGRPHRSPARGLAGRHGCPSGRPLPIPLPANSAGPLFLAAQPACALFSHAPLYLVCRATSQWFDLRFPDERCGASFHRPVRQLCVSFGEASVQGFCPFSDRLIWCFWC